jgi:hypothetical protein
MSKVRQRYFPMPRIKKPERNVIPDSGRVHISATSATFHCIHWAFFGDGGYHVALAQNQKARAPRA